MHRALYRKYRPLDFDGVVGQDHITSVLRYEVAAERTSHAYLFCGSRGTGKTTCAKILAKAVNCLAPVKGNPCGACENCRAVEAGVSTDVLEMDAASNTGVDYIRDIKDAVMYAPSMLKSRVYIIDEVHMLSDGAFNALLKTLEEPPANVVFILATTEMQKIPATILSRCQRFEFRRIAGQVIAERLLYIAEQEKIRLTDEAAYLIARNAQGGMRDAISLLELCGADGELVDVSRVEELAGGSGRKTVERTVEAIASGKGAELFDIVAELYSSSGDLSIFWQELISFYRDMIVVKTVKKMNEGELRKDILDLTESEYEKLKMLADRFKYETLMYHFTVLDKVLPATSGRSGISGRIAAEMALIRLVTECLDSSPEALSERISKLEDLIKSGSVALGFGEGTRTPENSVQQHPGILNSRFKEDEQENPAQGEIQEGEDSKELKSFVEVLHDYTKADPGVASFLTGAKACVLRDGRIRVCVVSDFAVTMLNNSNASAALELIIGRVEGVFGKVFFVCDRQCGTVPKGADKLNELT